MSMFFMELVLKLLDAFDVPAVLALQVEVEQVLLLEGPLDPFNFVLQVHLSVRLLHHVFISLDLTTLKDLPFPEGDLGLGGVADV